MTPSDPWFDVVGQDSPLDQGDLILRCPILTWDQAKPVTVSKAGDEEILKDHIASFRADVLVVTQACDLEHNKARNVVLCPHRPISEIRVAWEARMQQMGQAPFAKAWRRYCEDIADGYVWNQVFLNSFDSTVLSTELRLVDFHDLFTVPREFLESLLRQRQETRLRLRPPYREHLSQAFARFFMRVGLPQPVNPAW
jgi:hypothetical protein